MDSAEKLFTYREKEVDLPSGYVDSEGQLHKSVILREMSGEEEDLLLDETETKNGTSVTSVLNRLMKLKDKPSLKVAGELLMVDQLFLLVQARMLTYGNSYKFDVTCQVDACKKITRLNLDLSSLKFEGSPNPSSLEESVVLPATGIEIRFKKNQGKDQGNLFKLAQGKSRDKITQLLKYRVVEIKKDGKTLSNDMVKSLPGQDRKLLRETMNKAEGYAETAIDFECVHCNNSMKIQLPLNASFFCLTGEED